MSLPAHPPVKLDKYEVLDEIGHGGMATVYRARDRRLGREVAVKVIHRHLRESAEVGARFQSEALAVAKVKHPNIVEVYDVSGENEEEKYLVVELIRGITLRQLLLEQAPLPPEIAACIAVEVCRAIAVAHREGVVHRDIKPENVLISMAGYDSPDAARIKLTDFGIAKLLDAQGVTHTGQVLGSPAHMAPEQIEGGDVDARADVFGTGVLLYEMLTGGLPFEGKNPAQVLRKVLEGIFLPAERQLPRVGSGYGTIATTALARAADDRYSSAVAMEAALQAELAELGVVDVRREISRFLDDPKGYREKHETSFVDVIAQRAAAARAEGEIMRAAALFNRALAYRPDDTQLLAEVAGLARRSRMTKRLLSSAVVALVLMAISVTGYLWLSSRQAPPQARVKLPQKLDVSSFPPRLKKDVANETSEETAKEDDAPSEPAEDLVDANEAPPRPKVVEAPAPPVVPGTRAVRTPVTGPQNARVRIDGELKPWFQVHNLTVGPHTFEFVPPNSECCETSPPTTVDIVEGEGHQTVRGVIEFRPAILRLQGPEGSRASCGIGGIILAGGSKSIPMNRPTRRLSCTVFPPPNGKGEPKQIDVDLRPGRTFTLTGA